MPDVTLYEIEYDQTVDTVYDLLSLLEEYPVGCAPEDVAHWMSNWDRFRIVLAYRRGKPVGFAVVFVTPGYKEMPFDVNHVLLDVLYVRARYRGQNIGQVLVDYVKSEYPSGFTVRTDVADAIRFYKREGFRVLQTEPHALELGTTGTRLAWQPKKR